MASHHNQPPDDIEKILKNVVECIRQLNSSLCNSIVETILENTDDLMKTKTCVYCSKKLVMIKNGHYICPEVDCVRFY